MDRSGFFKNNNRGDENRKNRQYQATKLRKDKREEQILKRRQILEDGGIILEKDLQDGGGSPVELIDTHQIKEIFTVSGDDPNKVFGAVQSCRRILSRENRPPIDEVINMGILPHLVHFLTLDTSPSLQFESCWALTNIASGNPHQTRAVVEGGAVPHLMRLLSSGHVQVAEQAIWALGNVAGDSAKYRDLVIRSGIIPLLLNMAAAPSASLNLLRHVAWTLSNLCRNKDPPTSLEPLTRILPSIRQLLTSEDRCVLSDACWAISYITDAGPERVQLAIQSGVVKTLIDFLEHPDISVLSPALRAIGNIVTGSDEQTQYVVSHGVLSHFHKLLLHPKPSVQKEATWTISNITAGTTVQIQAVIDAHLLPLLVSVLGRGEFKCQREATWAVMNLTAGGTPQQIKQLYSLKCLPFLVRMLKVHDTKTLSCALSACFNILNNAFKISKTEGTGVAVEFEECGGVDAMERLQRHENRQVYCHSGEIIDRFFNDDDDEEEENDENIPPPDGTNSHFHFTTPDNHPEFRF